MLAHWAWVYRYNYMGFCFCLFDNLLAQVGTTGASIDQIKYDRIIYKVLYSLFAENRKKIKNRMKNPKKKFWMKTSKKKLMPY